MKYAELLEILSKYREFKIVINIELFLDFHKESDGGRDETSFLPKLYGRVYQSKEKIAYNQFAFLDYKFVCYGFDDEKIYPLKDLDKVLKQHKALLNFQ